MTCFGLDESGPPGIKRPFGREGEIMAADERIGTMIDLWLMEETYERPEMVGEAIRDIHAHDFDTVLLFNQSAIREDGCPEHIELIRAGVTEAGRLGMKALVAFNMYHKAPEFVRRHPKDCARILVEGSQGIAKGMPFEIHIAYPNYWQVGFDRVERLFLLKKDAEGFVKEIKDLRGDERISFDVETKIVYDDKAFTDRIKEVVLSGSLDEEGRLLAFVRFRTSAPDVSSPQFLQYIEEVLSRYRGIPLDGVTWDEASILVAGGNSWKTFYASDAFLSSFAEKYGYDVRDRLYLLKERSPDGSEVRVRADYFRHLRDVLARAQGRFKETAKKIFGAHTASGIHHTWSETDSADLRVGCIDYFHLRKVLTGGFVDNVFFFGEEATTYLSTLASSLSKGTETGEAVSNAWCYRPRDDSLEYHTRLLSLFNVRWFHIGYGDSSAVKYPFHRTWDSCTGLARRNREVGELLDGFERRSPNLLLHNWESLAFEHSPFTHLHRIGSIRLVHRAALRNIPFEIIGSEDLSRARIDGERIVRGDDRYGSLFIAWPSVLGESLWNLVEAFAKAGGRVVLYGPPLLFTPEGESLKERFLSLFGVEDVSSLPDGLIPCEKESLIGLAPFISSGEIPPDEDRSSKIWIRARERTGNAPLVLPYHSIRPGKAVPLLKFGDSLIGVKAKGLDAWYFSFDLPFYERVLLSVLEGVGLPLEARLPGGLFAQAYARGEEWAIVLAGRGKEARVEGTVSFEGATTTISPCRLAVLKGKRGREEISCKTW